MTATHRRRPVKLFQSRCRGCSRHIVRDGGVWTLRIKGTPRNDYAHLDRCLAGGRHQPCEETPAMEQMRSRLREEFEAGVADLREGREFQPLRGTADLLSEYALGYYGMYAHDILWPSR